MIYESLGMRSGVSKRLQEGTVLGFQRSIKEENEAGIQRSIKKVKHGKFGEVENYQIRLPDKI